ncbi:MAG: hypothetical protein PHH54_03020 [Candidatus Nanoarchaeia archaeon]|nr:hypothetical protein [Candidatus Nanoarchaeia archaeon]MDD5740932.1 hypothetical protein [Candidatus Nanoarchaeia archaeon]
MEKEVPEKNRSLAGLVGGIVIGIATLLPLSGCYEEYSSSGYYEPGYRNSYYSSPTIVVPIYPRPHRQRHFNNRPYGNLQPRYYPKQKHFNNNPYGNPPQRQHHKHK